MRVLIAYSQRLVNQAKSLKTQIRELEAALADSTAQVQALESALNQSQSVGNIHPLLRKESGHRDAIPTACDNVLDRFSDRLGALAIRADEKAGYFWGPADLDVSIEANFERPFSKLNS